MVAKLFVICYIIHTFIALLLFVGSNLGGINEDGDDQCNSPRRYSQYSSPGKPGQGNSLTSRQHNMMLGGGRSGSSMRSEAGYTNQTGKSVAESVISRATARKGKF